MSKAIINKIVDEINFYGISSCKIDQLLSEEELKIFERVKDFYKDYCSDSKIQSRIKDINEGIPNPDIKKWYEITIPEFLGRKLIPGDSIMDLYTCETLIDLASKFYNEDNVRLRNVQGWIHPHTKANKEIHSQRWHRDQEDFKILKVFILVNDIDENTGPTEFIKQTQHLGKYHDITYNMRWLDYYHNPTIYKKIRNAYVKRFRRYKMKYNPPLENFVKATGNSGTIYFINANGMHKGGFVKKGERHLLHGCYLKSDAPMIQYNKLRSYYDKTDKVDSNALNFQNLSIRQRNLFK